MSNARIMVFVGEQVGLDEDVIRSAEQHAIASGLVQTLDCVSRSLDGFFRFNLVIRKCNGAPTADLYNKMRMGDWISVAEHLGITSEVSKFARYGVEKKLRELLKTACVESSLHQTMINEFSCLYALRNCIVHRASILGVEDCNSSDQLEVVFRDAMLKGTDDSGRPFESNEGQIPAWIKTPIKTLYFVIGSTRKVIYRAGKPVPLGLPDLISCSLASFLCVQEMESVIVRASQLLNTLPNQFLIVPPIEPSPSTGGLNNPPTSDRGTDM